MDIPHQQNMMENLQVSFETLSGNWKCVEIESDITTSKDRFEKLNVDIKDVATKLPLLKKSFEDLPPLLESLAWVQEVLVLIDIDVEINDREDVDKEMNRLKVSMKRYTMLILIFLNLFLSILICFFINFLVIVIAS